MLKLNVGTNRKIGQPDYGSAGASCNLEVELDPTLFQDLDGLHIVIQRAYSACNQAVNDELARLTATSHQPDHHSSNPNNVQEVRISPVIHGARFHAERPSTPNPSRPSPRPATTSQVRAIRAICGRRKIDLVNLLQDRFGLHRADELGIRQASELIDELKADGTETTSSNGHYAGSGSGGAR
jgi:hypothetical protein